MKDEIRAYFDTLKPGDALREKTLAAVRAQRKKRRLRLLIAEYAASAAACLLFAFGVNALRGVSKGKLESHALASVFSDASGYLIGGAVFLLCAAAATVWFFRKNES